MVTGRFTGRCMAALAAYPVLCCIGPGAKPGVTGTPYATCQAPQNARYQAHIGPTQQTCANADFGSR